ncbi:MAG: glycosyltransferase family 4 protein [Nitrososphaeria archaeon]
MHSKTIAIITGGSLFYWGGGEKYALELAKRLSKDFNITIFSKTESSERRVNNNFIKTQLETHDNVKIFYYKTFLFPIIREYIPRISSFITLIKKLKTIATVINIDSSIGSLLLLSLLKFFYRTKLVFIVEDPYIFEYLLRKGPIGQGFYKIILFRYYKKFKLNLFKIFNTIVVINKDDINLLKRLSYTGRIVYIPNFLYSNIDPNKIKCSNKFIALYVGRFDDIYHKGLDLLVNEIIPQTLEHNKDIFFYFVGSGGTFSQKIFELERRYNGKVKYLGFLTGKNLEKVYNSANLFLFPSRLESFGLSLLEAQSYGLPAICFRVKGPKDIITKKFQGILIEPFNSKKFSNAILSFYTTFTKKRLMYLSKKKKICKYVHGVYNAENIIPKIEELL